MLARLVDIENRLLLQLPLQILDLLLLLLDLFGLVGKLPAEPFHLAPQTLNLAGERLRLRR